MRIRLALAFSLLTTPLAAQSASPAAIPARREFAHERHIRMEFHAPSRWTIVELTPMALDAGAGARGRTELRTSFRFPGHEPANAPGTVTFALVRRGVGEGFATKPALSLVLDGRAPVAVPVQRFARQTTADTTEKTVYATMPRATFLRLTSAERAEVRVDGESWALAPDMLEALRDLASRMSPAGYRAAKSERGMVAAADVDTTAGAARVYQASEVDAMIKPRGLLARPSWPVDAPLAKRRVVFRYVVDTTGRVDLSTVRSETPRTDSLFVESIRYVADTWRFTPARKSGRPVRVEVRQVLEFVPGK